MNISFIGIKRVKLLLGYFLFVCLSFSGCMYRYNVKLTPDGDNIINTGNTSGKKIYVWLEKDITGTNGLPDLSNKSIKLELLKGTGSTLSKQYATARTFSNNDMVMDSCDYVIFYPGQTKGIETIKSSSQEKLPVYKELIVRWSEPSEYRETEKEIEIKEGDINILTSLKFNFNSTSEFCKEGVSRPIIVYEIPTNNQVDLSNLNFEINGQSVFSFNPSYETDVGVFEISNNNLIFTAKHMGEVTIRATKTGTNLTTGQQKIIVGYDDSNNDGYADYSGIQYRAQSTGTGTDYDIDTALATPKVTVSADAQNWDITANMDLTDYVVSGDEITSDTPLELTARASVNDTSVVNTPLVTLYDGDSTNNSTYAYLKDAQGNHVYQVAMTQTSETPPTGWAAPVRPWYKEKIYIPRYVAGEIRTVRVEVKVQDKNQANKLKTYVSYLYVTGGDNTRALLLTQAQNYLNAINPLGYYARWEQEDGNYPCAKDRITGLYCLFSANSNVFPNGNKNSGIPYSYGCKDTVELFWEKLQKNGNISNSIGWIGYDNKFKVGEFIKEYDKINTDDGYNPSHWAGVDCSGFIQICMTGAGYTYIPKITHPTKNMDSYTVSIENEKSANTIMKSDKIRKSVIFDTYNPAGYNLSNVKEGDIVGFYDGESNINFGHIGIVSKLTTTPVTRPDQIKIIHAWGNSFLDNLREKEGFKTYDWKNLNSSPDYPEEFYRKVVETPLLRGGTRYRIIRLK